MSPNVGHLILKYLCPAVRDILSDGLKAYVLDMIIGQRRNIPWSVVEASTQLGTEGMLVAITLRDSCVVAGRCWGRLTIRIGMQNNNTHLSAQNRVHLDLFLQNERATALFCPNICCHFC